MARKGKNLFELLQMRATGGVPSPGPRAIPGAGEVVAVLRERFDGWWRRLSGRDRARGPARLSAIWVAAGAFGCLGAGFVFGRVTGSGSAEGDLRTRPRAESPAEFPDLPVTPAAAAGWRPPDLTQDKEVETLSSFFFVVQAYPDSARARGHASRVAYHLRQHGVESARIQSWERTDKTRVWLVLVYVCEAREDRAAQQAEEVLTKLHAVPALDIEPGLAEKTRALNLSKLSKRVEGR